MAAANLWESPLSARPQPQRLDNARYGAGLLRQTEEREQVRRVEERVDADDLTVGDLDDLERPRLVAAARPARPVLPERRRRRSPTWARGASHDSACRSRASTRGCPRGHAARARRAASTSWRPRGAATSAIPCRTARRRRRSGRGARGARRPSDRSRRCRRDRWRRASTRARCSALLTDATVDPSSSATSSAFNRRTSRRIRTARWRGGRCWRAAMKASRIDSRATVCSAGSSAATSDASVRDRLDPGDLGKRRSERRGRRLRGREVHRARPALAPVQHVEAHVGGDPVQPRTHRRPTLETIEAAPRPHQRLLDGVVGLERRPQHPVAVPGQPDPILLEVDVRFVRRSSRLTALIVDPSVLSASDAAHGPI